MKQNFVAPYTAPEPEPIEESSQPAPTPRQPAIRLPMVRLRVVLWASFCFAVYQAHSQGLLVLTWEWFNQVAFIVAISVGATMFYNSLVWRRDE